MPTQEIHCYRGLVFRPPIEKVSNFLKLKNPNPPGKITKGLFFAIDARPNNLGLITAAQWAILSAEDHPKYRYTPLVLEIILKQNVIDQLPGAVNKIVGELHIEQEKPIKRLEELTGLEEITFIAKGILPATYALLGLKVYQLEKGYSIKDTKLKIYKDFGKKY